MKIFRDELREVLLASVVLTDVPPDPQSEARLRRDALFDLCLPARRVCDIHQRASLEVLLSGDFSKDAVLWVVPSVQLADLSAWATRVSCLLYPCAISPIPRQRWLNSLDSQAEYTLLANCHNLLARVAPRWLVRISGQQPPPLPKLSLQSLLVPSGPCSDPWQFSDDEPQDGGGLVAEELVEVDPLLIQVATGAEAEVKAIIDFNEKQRGRAARFFASEPAHRLCVIMVCLGVAVAFLHEVESVAGSPWETANWARCAAGGPVQKPYDGCGRWRYTTASIGPGVGYNFRCKFLARLATFRPNGWQCGVGLLHGLHVCLFYRPDLIETLADMALSNLLAFGQRKSRFYCPRISCGTALPS